MQATGRWLLTLCAVPSILLGQTLGRALHAGDRVRVTARADSGIYIVRAVSRDTLTVEIPESASDALAYFPISAIRRLDVSRGREERATVAIRRSLLGGLGGAAVGGLLGYATGEDPPSDQGCAACAPSLRPMTRKEKAGAGALVVGGLGFFIGFFSGLGGGERWERVPLPARVSTTFRGDGVFALSYSF